MATYKQIHAYLKTNHGWYGKPCWIAHRKAENGVPVKPAPNRINTRSRKCPCPADKAVAVDAALRHFRIIS
ncbi:hypothetical protein PSP20601_02408 [Pandoraea sputorum]|nr:hypothetical protein PSP20601_02408 [Pandoraea sputorum]